jgi:hypothetical protein
MKSASDKFCVSTMKAFRNFWTKENPRVSLPLKEASQSRAYGDIPKYLPDYSDPNPNGLGDFGFLR